MQEAPLINRVANSGIVTINLENYYPKQDIVSFDLKEYLFKGLILKEKDFRTGLKELDTSLYADKTVLIVCSTDAIIPVWAYMLAASVLRPVAHDIFLGSKVQYLDFHFRRTLDALDMKEYDEKRIVIKGCSDRPVPPSAYAHLTALLQDHAQSIMYGEPCSTVPVFKRPRKL